MQEGCDRVRASYDADPAREWGRLEGGVGARLEYLITRHALARHLPPPAPGCPVLDAGGGPSRYALALAADGYPVTLLDLSPALLALARSRIAAATPGVRGNIRAVVEGSVTDLVAFSDARFRAVVCLGGVVSHLPEATDRARALRELRRVLHPDGVLFVSAFNRLAGFRAAVQWPAAWPQLIPHLLRGGRVPMGPQGIPTYAYDPEEFVADLAAAGLAVRALYGCQGLGAQLPEGAMLALMADEARWAPWRQVLLETCDHPAIVGVSSHLLAVTARAE